jgi:hypothetical protein
VIEPVPDFRAALAELLKDAAELRQQVHEQVQPASAAQHDIDVVTAQLGTPDPVVRVISLVDLWSSIIAEQLHDIGVLVEGGRSVFGIFPNLRSIIEHGAWVSYVLDNQVGSKQRAIRAALVELESEEKLVGALAHMHSKDDANYKAAKASLKRLREALAEHFDDFDSGTRTIGAQTIARPTDVVAFFGERYGSSRQWVGVYGYLCGMANHPSKSAFALFELREDGKTELTLSTDFLSRLVRAALAAYLVSLRCIRAYLGWAAEPIDDYQAQVLALLGPDNQ